MADLFDIAVARKLAGGGGGGGSSDFTTAKVTIVADEEVPFNLPVILAEGMGAFPTGILTATAVESGIYEIVLYKGKATVVGNAENTITTSGNIDQPIPGYPYYIISGDCTITIS